MKVPQRRLISEIAPDGYAFYEETRHQKIFRKRGGTHHVVIRKATMVEAQAARLVLRQVGRSPAEIEAFLESCRKDES